MPETAHPASSLKLAIAPDASLPARQRGAWRRRSIPFLLLLPTLLLMGYTFILPLLTFFQYSFFTYRRGRLVEEFSLETYRRFLFDGYYRTIILDTLWMSALVTIVAVIIGYPLAYALWRLERPWMKRWLSLIIFSPIIVSVVVRSYGWTVLLADQGPLNWMLLKLGLISAPLTLVFNLTGVVISLSHVFLPFIVFPIYASMTRLDPALREAAMDLGAGWWFTFRRVTLPLTLPGLVAATQIAFTLALGAFVTPAMLGGGRVQVLPLQVYHATTDINWPVAAVGGLTLLLMAFVSVALFNRLLKYSEA
ncbi:ABC transporter permease [Microvirga antarctica]|uniref:ABC transporter permease n=1 Tax=Microvirga antarctica TaxID=2819233 RepID=UPI001B303435|nr:ABC transporter permease [Microvirga antarctica]